MSVNDFRQQVMNNFDYDPVSGLFTRKRGRNAGKMSGHVSKISGYVTLSLNNENHYAHRIAWLITYGSFPTNQIDHVDGNRSNNRISNLRESTKGENNRNKAMQSNNTTGFVGVRFNKKLSKWQSGVALDKKVYHAGTFITAKEAAIARHMLAIKLHGDYAKLNCKYSHVDGMTKLVIESERNDVNETKGNVQ